MFAVCRIVLCILFAWISSSHSGLVSALSDVDDELIAACTSPRGEDNVELVIQALQKVWNVIPHSPNFFTQHNVFIVIFPL
jgi:hypothetical protein